MPISSSDRYALLNQLVDEFAARYRRGERPAVQEYQDRYPELAEDIQELFPAVVEIQQVKADRRAVEEPAPAAPAAPIEQIGDFRILREIGRGGMGVVYEAEQVSLNRHVALKLLPRKMLLAERARQRFEREAKSAARLHHTNIVPVFGVGEHDGLPYYVMQYIQGLGLDQVLDELKKLQVGTAATGSFTSRALPVPRMEVSAAHVAHSLLTGDFPLAPERTKAECSLLPEDTPASEASKEVCGGCADPFTLSSSSLVLPGQSGEASKSHKKQTYWQSVARIGVQVAQALDYAHLQGVLHRDIKPSNLLLDARGTVWVTDFGLAKTDDQQDLTHTGDILGTLRYMPPEAFDGKADTRSDLYSLGLTLYEMLTFRPAFDETDRHKLIKHVTSVEPVRLSKLNLHVPRDLETIVHKAIDREPAHRYQSASELAADLQRFIDDEPIQARRLSTVEKVGRWCRRNPALASMSAIVLLLLVTLAGGASLSALWLRDERNAAVQSAAKADTNSRHAADQEKIAQVRAAEAQEQRLLAEKQERLARRRLYATQMSLAQHALESDNPSRALELLESQRPKFDQEDLRCFEWYYLWDKVQRGCRQMLAGPPMEVRALNFLSDGKRLAAGYEQGVLVLWDVTTGSQQAVLHRGGWGLGHLAVSPDGKTLAQGSGSWPTNTVTLWDTATLKEKFRLPGITGHVWGIAISPDGKLLATGQSRFGIVNLWDLATGRAVTAWKAHNGPVAALRFSPAGTRLVTTSPWEDKSLKLWDMGPRPPRVVKVWPGGIPAFSPDGKTLAVGMQGEVRLWDLATGTERQTFLGAWGEVHALAFSPDGQKLAFGTQSRIVRVENLVSGDGLVYPHLTRVGALAFHPGGQLLASAGSDGVIKLWDLATAITAAQPPSIVGTTGFKILADNRTLASGSVNGVVKLWDLKTLSQRATLAGHRQWVHTLACSPDGSLLATASWDKTVKLWDVATGKERATLKGHTKAVYGVAFSPDSKCLISASADGTIRVWDPVTANGRVLVREAQHEISSLAFSPNGGNLATGLSSGAVKLRDAATGKEMLTFQHASASWTRINDLAFSPDSKMLAIGDDTGTVKLRDATNGKLLASFKNHTRFITGLAFFPDGKTLAASSADLVLWDVATGQERLTLKGAEIMAVSPNGKLLAARADDRLLVVEPSFSPEARAPRTELGMDDPDSPLARQEAGNGLLAAGRFAEAEAAYQSAAKRWEQLAEHFPESAVYSKGLAANHAAVGDLFRQTGRFADAAQAYRRATELITGDLARNPGQSALMNWRVETLIQMLAMMAAAGESEEAKLRWLECLPLLGDRALASNNLAWFIVRDPETASQADLNWAVDLAREGVEQAPGDWSRTNTLGVALYRAADYPAACKSLAHSIEQSKLNSLTADAFFLAMAHWQLHQPEPARRWYHIGVVWMDKFAGDGGNPEFPRFRTEAASLLGESEHPLSEQELETVTQDQLRRQVKELLREKEK